MLAVRVLGADLHDRVGGRVLVQHRRGDFPRMRRLFADCAYAGGFSLWLKEHVGWDTQFVSQPPPARSQEQEWHMMLIDGVPVPRRRSASRQMHPQAQRWKIERTFGWLIRSRRLARDYEGLPHSAEAMIQVAAIRLCLKRLTPFCPAGS